VSDDVKAAIEGRDADGEVFLSVSVEEMRTMQEIVAWWRKVGRWTSSVKEAE
jgi:hypothetical protein